jgi:hypothetical protein
MLVIPDDRALRNLVDASLKALLKARCEELSEEVDGGWTALVRFIALEPGDPLPVLDAELGFPILEQPFELIEEHAAWFEIVFVLSDDGAGIEVFVPKHCDIDRRLLALCRTHSFPSKDQHPS